MLERILHFSIRQRWLVLIATLAVAVFGIYNYQRLPIDAVPDITNVQVQINTEAPGYSPLEAEQRITFPVETAMAGLPHLEETRSISRYGLSQVTVVFEDGTDIYFARQLINERIQEAAGAAAAGVEPTMGPIATGLGEIFLWTVEAEPGATTPTGQRHGTDLRTIQDWIVRPQLRNVPGVVEVNTHRRLREAVSRHAGPDRSSSPTASLPRRDRALAREQRQRRRRLHRAERRAIPRSASPARCSLEDIRRIVVGTHSGAPIYLDDVADVLLGQELRTGAATENGEEVVLGTVFMLMGENSRIVSQRVAAKMEEVNRTLPDGVVAKTVYDRTDAGRRAPSRPSSTTSWSARCW